MGNRRAQPYLPFGPPAEERVRLPMDAPTRATSTHFGDQAMIGLSTVGVRVALIPIAQPYAGQGTTWPVFPNYDPSNVVLGGVVKPSTDMTNPNSISKPLIVAKNLFSPIHHSNPLDVVVPPRAVKPTKVVSMPPKIGRGTGGHYTIPAPQANPDWPTSSQWLANKTIR